MTPGVDSLPQEVFPPACKSQQSVATEKEGFYGSAIFVKQISYNCEFVVFFFMMTVGGLEMSPKFRKLKSKLASLKAIEVIEAQCIESIRFSDYI